MSGNFIDAEIAFTNAIELNPQLATAYNNRGSVYSCWKFQ